jgi:hypothetical protein
MRRIIIGVLISMLVISSFMGAMSSAPIQRKSTENEPIGKGYSHNIFAEFFTMTTCVPCKYSHQALVELYEEGYHPFYYITYVYNKNNHSRDRKNELFVVGSPTTKFDGGFKTVTGGSDTETEKTRFNNSILACGNRTVKDIDLDLHVEWNGAVREIPENNADTVPIETDLFWKISEMIIDVDVTNNEADEYDGHIHVQVTEVESEWYDDKFNNPYTFEFKDYAANKDIPLDAGETWSDTIYWDGFDHNDKDDPPRDFGHMKENNTMVVAAVFDKDNDKYVDETAGFRVGVGTDPKTFDVYFGDSYPPPKVLSNGSAMKFNIPGVLNWSTTYYWRVDIWNNNGELRVGDDFTFTTRGNAAPNEPSSPVPWNGSKAPIDTNISWSGGDPDGDDVEYDIYFDIFNPHEDPELIEEGFEGTSYDPSPVGVLEFNTQYEWYIVAWDEYGLNSTGSIWNFHTEENEAPYPAKDPIPANGAKNVPGDVIICWNGTDPNSGDTLEYDVYFGPNPSPPKVQTQSATCYDPLGSGELPLFEDWYWKIVTRDSQGLETEGPEWTFSTGINPPPTDPEINGPTRSNPDIDQEFTFVSYDPDDQTIMYIVDWGDDTPLKETGYYNNGTVVTLNHSWTEKDKFTIRAKAIDTFGEESEWSEFEIEIPRGRPLGYNTNLFNWIQSRFPQVYQLLKLLFGL